MVEGLGVVAGREGVSSTVDDALRRARRRVQTEPGQQRSSEIGRRELVLLLAHVLGWEESRVWAHGEHRLSPGEASVFAGLVDRRFRGEPFAYLVGEREFYGRRFAVDRRVLIPRPETEHLVEAALDPDLFLPVAARCLDVGTGCGCLAVTLACERPDWRVWGSDVDLGALEVARANRRRHAADCRLLAADVLDPVRLGRFDLVVSNPPYVHPEEASHLAADVVDHEPCRALFAPGGTQILERLLDAVAASADAVGRPGHLLLEIGWDQAAWMREAVASRKALRLDRIERDHAGHLRIARIGTAR